jgi:parvulin-like peptidyl-prolyl isomerase
MNMKMKRIFFAAAAAAFFALPRAHAVTGGVAATNAPAGAATNSNPPDALASLFGDPVVAKGKGFEIKQSQLDGVVDAIKQRAAAQGQAIPSQELPAITATALKGLIANQILFQQATAADKAEGQKDADQYIAATIKHYGSQSSVEELLKASNKTFADWRNDMTVQSTATVVLTRLLNAAPSQAEIQKFYDDNTNASELPEQAHIRHIRLLTIDPATHAPLSDDQVQAKRKQMDEILKRARAGGDFAKLADEYSEDPSSKGSGGELPPLSRAQLPPQMAAVAFSLTNHQVSDVVETPYGFELIQLLDKTPARKLALNDKLPGTDSDMTLADYLKERLTALKLQQEAPAYIEKLSRSPGVEVLDPSLKTLMSAQTNAPVEAPPAPNP